MNDCTLMANCQCIGQTNCTQDCPMQYCVETPCDNGSVQVTATSVPALAQDKDMNWVPIDTTIDPTTMSTKATPYKVIFKSKITTPAAVSFISSVGSVAFYLRGWGFPGHYIVEESSNAIIDGNNITYNLSFGKITYECNVDGLKETIYITNRYSLPDPSALGLQLNSLNVEFDFALPQQIYERELIAFTPNREISDKVTRTKTGVAISYGAFANATLPITIDPTLYAAANNDINDMRNGAYAGTAANFGYEGAPASYDDKTGYTTPGYYHNWRAFFRFRLTNYNTYTLYDINPVDSTKRSKLALRILSTSLDSESPISEEITEQYWSSLPGSTLQAGAWSAPTLFNLGVGTSVVNGFEHTAAGLTDRLILAKAGITNSDSNIVFRVRAQTQLTAIPSLGLSALTVLDGTFCNLTFTAYSLINQADPVVNGSKITIGWTNGGGLKSGDYHRIYYKLGTGYTADQLILEGTCINSSGYTATSVITPDLQAGTYSILVVDTQVINSTGYNGARSAVKMATITQQAGQVITLTGHSDAGATSYGKLNLVQPVSGNSNISIDSHGSLTAMFNMAGHSNAGLDGYGSIVRLLTLSGHSSMGATGHGDLILVGYVEHIVDLSGHSEMGALAGGRYAIVNFTYFPIYPWPDREINDFLERIPEMYMTDRVIMEVDELPVIGNTIALVGKFTNFNGTPGDPLDMTVKVMDSKRTVLWQMDVNETHKAEDGTYVVPYIVPNTNTMLFYEYAGLLEGLPVVRRIPIGVPEYFEMEE